MVKQEFYASSFDKLQDLINILYNHLKFGEQWRERTKFEIFGMIKVLYNIADKEKIDEIDYEKAIWELEQLGIETIPIPYGFQKTEIDCVGII